MTSSSATAIGADGPQKEDQTRYQKKPLKPPRSNPMPLNYTVPICRKGEVSFAPSTTEPRYPSPHHSEFTSTAISQPFINPATSLSMNRSGGSEED